MKEKAGEYKYAILFIAMLFCYYMYSMSKVYGFELLPDEFGYWNYAAFLLGYDWSNIVSLGSYYSFGYTLILYPILKFFENPILAYRIAATLNFVLLILSYFAVVHLTKKLCKKEKQLPYLFTAIAILYPSWIFYARITMAEIVIMSMYIFICTLLYDYLEKNKASTLVLLVIALIYIYTVHMRTVGILIAAAMTLGIHLVVGSKRFSAKKMLIVLAGIGLFIGAAYIKTYISKEIYVYSSKENFATNDYAGQIEKIKRIFSGQGFQNLVISFLGKVFYLGLATFGLFYAGIGYCIKKLIKSRHPFYLFVLLSTLGEIGITSIACGVGGSRIDGLTYGRYNEQILPILMVFGCLAIWEAGKTWKQLLTVVLMQLPMLGVVLYHTQKYQQTEVNPWMILGISYGYVREKFEPISFYLIAFMIGILLMLLIWGIIRLAKSKKTVYYLVFVMAVELLLALRLQIGLADAPQLGNYRDTKLIEEIVEEKSNHPRIVYLHLGQSTAGQRLQYGLRNEKLEVETDVDSLQKDDLVITNDECNQIEELKEEYKNWRIMGHLAMFYN